MFKSKEEAKFALEMIRSFLADNLELELNEKTQIFKSKQGINFCGYKINPYRLKIRDRGKRKIKKKVKELKYRIRVGEIDSKEARKYLCGHFGYIKYANVKNLAEKIFEMWNWKNATFYFLTKGKCFSNVIFKPVVFYF